jgi:hypothetical protein
MQKSLVMTAGWVQFSICDRAAETVNGHRDTLECPGPISQAQSSGTIPTFL